MEKKNLEEPAFKEEIAKEAFPEETFPEKTMPQETFPEETMPEETMPQETFPEEVLPEETKGENSSASLYAPLAKIGINIQLGLDYCCGEDDFYMEMLRMFCSQAPEKKAEIITLYETENWSDYTVKVHALKSTSLTVGAERLAEQAKMLEQAGKKGNIEYIRHSHPTLLRLYDQICETIAGL